MEAAEGENRSIGNLATDVYDPGKRSKVMSAVRSKNTKPELIVRSRLHVLGLPFQASPQRSSWQARPGAQEVPSGRLHPRLLLAPPTMPSVRNSAYPRNMMDPSVKTPISRFIVSVSFLESLNG
jgi:hypothetical protein